MKTEPIDPRNLSGKGQKNGITLDQLRYIVQRLANQCWVRYWIHFNIVHGNPTGPPAAWEMAMCCVRLDDYGEAIEAGLYEPDLPAHIKVERDGLTYYVFKRVNEQGEPFSL